MIIISNIINSNHIKHHKNVSFSGSFAVLSLMTHSAIQKVMLKYSLLKDETVFQNEDKVFDYFNNSLSLNVTNGTDSNFALSKSLTDFDELKPIHVATAIMFISGFIQVIRKFSLLIYELIFLFFFFFKL